MYMYSNFLTTSNYHVLILFKFSIENSLQRFYSVNKVLYVYILLCSYNLNLSCYYELFKIM